MPLHWTSRVGGGLRGIPSTPPPRPTSSPTARHIPHMPPPPLPRAEGGGPAFTPGPQGTAFLGVRPEGSIDTPPEVKARPCALVSRRTPPAVTPPNLLRMPRTTGVDIVGGGVVPPPPMTITITIYPFD